MLNLTDVQLRSANQPKATTMRIKWINRYDSDERKFRIGRLMWLGTDREGKQLSSMFSVSLHPRLLWFKRDLFNTRLSVLGIALHLQRSWGGIHC